MGRVKDELQLGLLKGDDLELYGKGAEMVG